MFVSKFPVLDFRGISSSVVFITPIFLLGKAVVVVRYRLFNRHFDVPWEQTGLIHLQTLFQLQVDVSAHETIDKLLTEPVSPV